MDLEPNDLMLFASVVDAGSLSAAAVRLGVPKSTVSRRLTALEAQIGERLLLRTTRKLTVTELGVTVLEHARHVAEDVHAVSDAVQNRKSEPSGRLRVTMPADMANLLLAPLLAEFVIEHPAVNLEVDLSARIVDLIGENFDVALRMGDLPDDATLAARRLAVFVGGLFAGPSYLRRRGMPSRPEELLRHDLLSTRARSGEPLPWTLHRGQKTWSVVPAGRAMTNSPEVQMRMAIAGAGITMAHDEIAAPYVRTGELVRVLPEWRSAPVSAWAVFQGRRLMPVRTRVFVDALAARFSECDGAGGAPADREERLRRRNAAKSAKSPAARKR